MLSSKTSSSETGIIWQNILQFYSKDGFTAKRQRKKYLHLEDKLQIEIEAVAYELLND